MHYFPARNFIVATFAHAAVHNSTFLLHFAAATLDSYTHIADCTIQDGSSVPSHASVSGILIWIRCVHREGDNGVAG